MKTLKITGIVLVVLIVLFFLIALILPSKIHVERSLVIPASQETVFNEVNNLRQWEKWSPWHRRDPNMKITYEGFLRGEGASYSWKSDKVGSGKLTITESHPHQYIATSMDFMESGTANGFYRFEQVEGGTKVVWGFDTDLGNSPIGRYIGLMMDDMVGDDFEEGLQNLKTHIQQLPSEKMMTKEIPESTSG